MSGDTKKRKVGRPTKYKPEFCQVVQDVGAYGGWLCEMAEACDVSRNIFDVWVDTHPEFLEALTRAKQKAQLWYEVQGRMGLTAERFNAALWSKTMSARHRTEYTERKEVTGADGGAIKTEEVGGSAKLEAFLSSISDRQSD